MKRYFNSKFALVFLGLIALALASNYLHFRIDMTEDDVFSISQGSREIAKELKEPIEIRFYLSRSVRNMPIVLKQYGQRIQEVLGQYQIASQGKLSIVMIDPKPDSLDEEAAISFGLRGIPTPAGDRMYLGIVLLQGAQEKVIPFLDPRKEDSLEFELSSAIVGFSEQKKPKIGVLSGLTVFGQRSPDGRGRPDWYLIKQLKERFELLPISTDTIEIQQDLDVLFILHPKNLSMETLYAIDQYLMGGGNLMVALDPFSRTEIMEAQARGRFQPGFNPSSHLDKLLNHYGIQFDSAQVVGDVSRATQLNIAGQRIFYPLLMTLGEDSFHSESAITSQLKQILFSEGGEFITVSGKEDKFQPLISTSDNGSSVFGNNLMMMSPVDLAARFKGVGSKKLLSGILRDRFSSAFNQERPNSSNPKAHKSQRDGEGLIFVLGDVDFLFDQNTVEVLGSGANGQLRPKNDNLNFVVNGAEYLTGRQNLMSIRSIGKVSRPFEKLLEIQRAAQERWQAQEEALSSQLQALQERLAALQQTPIDSTGNLNTTQELEIAKFREEERELRRKRREVRKNLREDIEGLGRRLLAFNLLTPSLLVILFGLWFRRSRRS